MDEVLSEEKVKKDINEMGGNIPGGNFPGGNFPGGSLMGENFRGKNFPGGIFLEPFRIYQYLPRILRITRRVDKS